MTQLSLFPDAPTPWQVPPVAHPCCIHGAADAALDAAIAAMQPGYLYHIIMQVLSTAAADLLAELRQTGGIDRDRVRSNAAFDELVKKGCVTRRRNGKRLDAHLVRRNIIRLGTETDQRVRRWSAAEAGVPESDPSLWPALNA
jgi:hypothetical protein